MFRGLSFDVCGDLYASQFEVRSQIYNAGGNVVDIKNEWSSSLPTYILSSKATLESGTNGKLLRAQQFKVPILESTYIRDSIQANGLLPVSKYQLWAAPPGEQPCRPRPPIQPPPPKPEPPKAAAVAKPPPAPSVKAAPSPQPTPATVVVKSEAPVSQATAPAAPPPQSKVETPAQSRRKSKEDSANGLKKTGSKKDMKPFDITHCNFHVAKALQNTAAFAQREQILQAIYAKKCTMIAGAPGCGKTSVVPLLILDAGFIAAGKQVICVQAHPSSAVATGEFVALKRLGNVGAEVGYQVRFVNRTGPNTRLIYATTDLMLRRLQIDPQLASVGCVILDDVHTRDLHTEALLGILRDIVRKKGSSLKLVLIGGLKDQGNAEDRLTEYLKPNTLRIVRLQSPQPSVVEHYLEDALSWVAGSAGSAKLGKSANPLVMWKEGQMHNLIQDLALRFHAKEQAGAILIFLPEWNDVAALNNMLSEATRDFKVLVLHSLASSETLQQAFGPTPLGKRKVILATDFAETCANFKDVRYVIDSGVSKSEVYDEATGRHCLVMSLVTRESALRRCQACPEGAVVHLFMASQRGELPSARFRSRNLEDLVLQRKVAGAPTTEAITSGLLTAPSRTALANAVTSLQHMHALSSSGEVTPLGRLVSRIPVPPIVAKLLLWGAALRVLKPCAVVAAFLSTHSPFICDADDSKLDFDPECQSDHLALVQAYAGWQEADKKNDITFCARHRLSADILEMTQVLVGQFVSLMMEAGYDGPDVQKGNVASYADVPKLATNSADVALLKCCVTAAFHPNTFCIQPAHQGAEGVTFLACSGEVANPNSKFLHVAANKQPEHRWVVHSRAMHLEDQLQFMDSTLVSHNYVALFCSTLGVDGHQVEMDGWQAEAIEGQEWDALFSLREKVTAKFQDCIKERNFSLFPDDLIDEVFGYVTGDLLALTNTQPCSSNPPAGSDHKESTPVWAPLTTGEE